MSARRRRPNRRRPYRTAIDIEKSNRRNFHEMAHSQRGCQECGAVGPYESHHVVEKSELRRVGRMDLVWDTRNCMRLCATCHGRHTRGSDRVKLAKLKDMHYDFAFYVLGARAHSYLRRMYNGKDPRLDQYLERWEEENGAVSGTGS